MSFRPTTPLAVTCAVGMSLLLAACSSSTPTATAGQENEEKVVKFAKCLREHGIDASTSDSQGGLIKVNGGGASPQTMEAAQQACARYRPTGGKENLTPQQRVEREEAVQKFAKCMREHAIKVEASTAGGAIKIGIHAGRGAGGPNPESPAFQSAQKACSGLLPFKGQGGPGGPVKSGPGSGSETGKAKPGGGGESGFGIAAGG